MSTTDLNVRKLPDDLVFQPPNCTICAEYTEAIDGGFSCFHCGIAWDEGGANPERLDPDAKQCTSLYRPHHQCSHPRADEPEYRCWGDVDHNSKHYNPGTLYDWSTAQQTGEASS